jgi:hypothetical protein
MTPRRALVSLAAVAVLVPGALAACSGDDDDDTSSTTEGSSSALPPVIVEVGSLDGTTVEVPEGGAIDVTGDDETYTDWTAEIADPAIVSFTPGRDDGSAQFNPGFDALAVGSTEVTLTNSSSGETLTFTVDVVAAD